jgi:hypothetical protein
MLSTHEPVNRLVRPHQDIELQIIEPIHHSSNVRDIDINSLPIYPTFPRYSWVSSQYPTLPRYSEISDYIIHSPLEFEIIFPFSGWLKIFLTLIPIFIFIKNKFKILYPLLKHQ